MYFRLIPISICCFHSDFVKLITLTMKLCDIGCCQDDMHDINLIAECSSEVAKKCDIGVCVWLVTYYLDHKLFYTVQ